MKKFSWIFALILALSIGFIGCPAPEEETTKGGSTTTLPDPGFVPNPDATEISVPFGAAGSGKTTVYFENGSGVKAGDIYYDTTSGVPTDGYRYTYGTGANTNYGNAIGRFKVDLGDFRLGDYYASFKWEGLTGDVGLSGDKNTTITYTKNLLLLATDDEDEITPWKSDADVKALVVNTDFFALNPAKDLYDSAAGVPGVRSLKAYPDNQLPVGITEPYEITTPIKVGRELTGEVYIAFYFHATGGSYQISDFKLIPLSGVDYNAVKKDPPPPPVAPPPAPANIPDGFKEIKLDLSVANCSDASAATNGDGSATNFVTTVPAITSAAGVLTVPFTLNNQRLNVKLSEAQKTVYYANMDAKDVYVQIDCEIDGTDNEDNFRYHLGVINTSASWNATNGSGDFPLLKWKGDAGGIAISATGKGLLQTDANKNDTTKARADYFIFQYRGQAGATVKINSISLWVPGKPKGPTVDLAPTAATIGKNNTTVTDITGGVSIVTTEGYRNAWVYFKVELPSGKTVADYETLSYTIKSIEVTGLGDGGAWKGGFIYGFDTLTEITDLVTAGYPSTELDPDVSKTHAGADAARAHLLVAAGAAATGTQDHGVDYSRNVKLTNIGTVLTQTATEFYIVFSWGGSAGMNCELKNIKLVAGIED
jgi:hypothetical protein